MGTPAVWLGGALVICLGLFVGSVALRHAAEVKGARTEGIAIGTGQASTAALESATETAKAERIAEDAVQIEADRKKLIAICNKSASCRERGKFQ